MKPSVGRIVLVSMDPAMNNGAGVAPAVITRVWDDTTVNVHVLPDGHVTEWQTSATYVDSLDEETGGLYRWTWPPRI
ncbi:hypothetical protein J7I98_23560 [Streptomyces sp. ISL-98]|uniref:hypothetical protein n=1 Tax=Streptomyces sp. ISL-98 TaxID=2819192 RepID=UPI001BE725E6|nr:hypothetical protein [Streptomyces sp. ISL-98]MBT2508808.1 hypothetical protein [Streptomyces sp. ISL-98]